MIRKRSEKVTEADEVLSKEAENWGRYLENFRLEDVEQFLLDEESTLEETPEGLKVQPLISVVLTGENQELEQIEECIDSIERQTYSHWELLLLEHPSIDEELKSKGGRLGKSNPPVKRISNVTEVAGEYFLFVERGDILAPFALLELVKKLNEEGEWNYLYTDEDKISLDGQERSEAFFKPDWSPDLVLSLFYTRHLSLYSSAITRQVGGLDDDFPGDKIYDFTLRFTEAIDPKTIGHIPKICYHRRKRGETNTNQLLDNGEGAKVAIQESLARRKIKGVVKETEFADGFRVLYETKGIPLVSIVIPSKDNEEVLLKCLSSIENKTRYNHYEVIVVDNGSTEEVKNRLEEMAFQKNWKYIYQNMPFNFSRMCNIGADYSRGDYLLFLNDDIEVMEEDWLKVMLGQGILAHSGAVGAKLLYPNSNRIQHIGVMWAFYGPDHPLLKHFDDVSYYFGRNRLAYNYIGVTGACLLVKKEKYLEVGGMDENFPIAFNDVDLCIKLYQAGYFNVMRNDVWLIHHESLSRGDDLSNPIKLEEMNATKAFLSKKYPEYAGKDPYYNVNLSEYPKRDFSFKKSLEKGETEVKVCEIREFPKGRELFRARIERINCEANVVISGWVLTDEKVDFLFERVLVLQNDEGETIEATLNRMARPDISEIHGPQTEYSGFNVCINSKWFNSDKRYQIGVWAKHELSEVEYFSWTNKWFSINGLKRFEVGTVKVNDAFYQGQELIDDGSIEDEMLEIAKSYPREEYNEIIYQKKDGEILSQFSHLRENILSWFPISSEDIVLEIGAGYGAVTGALVKKAKKVVGVDLSMKGSLTNALRHRDCENLELHVGSFEEVEGNLREKYDVITLIEAFEEASKHVSGENPYEDFLHLVKKHLKKKGKIVIATNNRFGLKYFAGVKEEHTGRYFEGIEGYKNTLRARTFSHAELEKLLKKVGFEDWKFYYPYPDYKFPQKIFSEEYLPIPNERSGIEGYNFDEERLVLFDEKPVCNSMIQDEMYPYFSNSFLIVIEGD